MKKLTNSKFEKDFFLSLSLLLLLKIWIRKILERSGHKISSTDDSSKTDNHQNFVCRNRPKIILGNFWTWNHYNFQYVNLHYVHHEESISFDDLVFGKSMKSFSIKRRDTAWRVSCNDGAIIAKILSFQIIYLNVSSVIKVPRVAFKLN